MLSFKASNHTGESQLLKVLHSLQGTRVQLAIGLKEQAQLFIAASSITGEAPILLSAHGAGNAAAWLESDRWTRAKPAWIERAPHLQA